MDETEDAVAQFPPNHVERSLYHRGQLPVGPVPTITVSMADEYVRPVLPSIVVTPDPDRSPTVRTMRGHHVLATTAQSKRFLSVDDARRSFDPAGSDLVKMASLPRVRRHGYAPPSDVRGNRDNNARRAAYHWLRQHNAAKRMQLKAEVTSSHNDVIHVGRQTKDNSERATVSCKGSDDGRFWNRNRVDSRSRVDSREGCNRSNNARKTDIQIERSGGCGEVTEGGMENGSELYVKGGWWGAERVSPGEGKRDNEAVYAFDVSETHQNESTANVAAYENSGSVYVVSDVADAGAICFELGEDNDIVPEVPVLETAETGVSTQTDDDTEDDDDNEEEDDVDDDDDDNKDNDDDAEEVGGWCTEEERDSEGKASLNLSASPRFADSVAVDKSPCSCANVGTNATEMVRQEMTSTGDAASVGGPLSAQEEDDDEGCVLTTDTELAEADAEPPMSPNCQPKDVSDCSESDTITEATHVVLSDIDVAPPLPLDPVESAETCGLLHGRSIEVSPCRALGKSWSEGNAAGAHDAEYRSGIPVASSRRGATKAKSACEKLLRSRNVRASRSRKSGSSPNRKASIPRPTGRASSVAAVSKLGSTHATDKLDPTWTDDSDGGDAARRRRRRSSKQTTKATTRSRNLTQSFDAGSPRMSSGSQLTLVRTRFKEAVVTKPAEVIFTICGNVNSDSSVTRHGRVPVVQCATNARRQHGAETNKSRLKCEAYCHDDGMMQVTMSGSLRQLKPIVAGSAARRQDDEIKCAPTLQVDVVVERDPLGSGRDPPKIPKSVYRKPASPPKKRRPHCAPAPPDRNILDTRASGPCFITKLPSPRFGKLRHISGGHTARVVKKSCLFY